MTRQERITAIALEVDAVGNGQDLGLEDIDDPKQYLLVEKNFGRAGDEQSHYFTTHDSLDDAAAYHLGQEYREDWQIVFAVDLDTDARMTAVEPETLVTWQTAGGENIGGNDWISREAIIEALREAHENDSAADAVEFVSSIVGWSWEDESEAANGDSPLPDPPEKIADAWRRFQAGEHVEPYEARAIDEWRANCAQDAGF